MSVAVRDWNVFAASLERMRHSAAELRVCYLYHKQHMINYTSTSSTNIKKHSVLEARTKDPKLCP